MNQLTNLLHAPMAFLLASRQQEGNSRARRRQPVKIGKRTVFASGAMWLTEEDMDPRHLIVPLTNFVPYRPGVRYQIMPIEMRDMGGVPHGWDAIVQNLAQEVKGGAKAHIMCDAGQGRTGTVIGSLIAVTESTRDTPDPIAAVRERYCPKAVETMAQGMAVFALRGQPLPAQYYDEFARRVQWARPVGAEGADNGKRWPEGSNDYLDLAQFR
jgi:hypothetical protein